MITSERNATLPPPVRETLDIHLIAVGGTGMAPLACLLKELGHRVRGSDAPLYPPMSTLLANAGIEPFEGYDPAHLDPPPDLVVVGNAVPRDNPEAAAAEDLGLPRMSMPEALAHFFLADRSPLVVAGTHGKTTTTALAAWALTDCGADPGYLVGGVPLDLPGSFRRGSGRRFVVEGDEYNAAYFDRGAKFLHYRPETLILTSVEYDHADLYDSPETLLEAYRRLVRLVPESGRVIACGDSPGVLDVVAEAAAPVVTYGWGQGNDLRAAADWESGAAGSRFVILDPEAGPVETRLGLSGRHNVSNALAVWAAVRRDGHPAARVAAAFARFRGVARRMQELASRRGITVVDDFAHHPTAVRETLDALRRRYPGRRLVAVFEPRSLTAGRRLFFDAYVDAFTRADRVHLAPIFHAGRLSDDERLDADELARAVSEAGTTCSAARSIGDLEALVLAETTPGDVLVTMSSGSFDGLPGRLAAAVATAS